MWLRKSQNIVKFVVCDFRNLVLKNQRNQCINRGRIPSSLSHQNFGFHTNVPVLAKSFFDKENQYAHHVLEISDNYKLYTNLNFNNQLNKAQSIDDILKNCSTITDPNELHENFVKIVNYCNQNEICISDDKFDKFINLFMDNCYKLNDEQLINSIRLLSLLPITPTPYTKNYVELWNSLDNACTERIEKWSIDELLLACDCWYALNLSKPTNFVWNALRKIGRKIRKLNPKQMVQAMFICNLLRKPLLEMFDFEIMFDKCIEQLTLKEIGVMSMGYFKTQTPIRNPELINTIYKRLINEIDTVEDITLVNILKILRYSSKLQQTELMYELLKKLCSQINRISILACLHVALLGVEIQLCEDKCIELIIERFNNDLNDARIKEMERMCHVMSLFNIKTVNNIEKELCKNIIIKIKDRIEEIIKYPQSFSTCVYYLTLCGYHDEELINATLNQEFIKHAYGKNLLLGRELFLLDSFVRINLKNTYNGNYLNDKQRKTMGKCLTNYIPEKNSKYKLNVTDRILIEIKDICNQLTNNNCYFKHVLPHFERPDIIFCYDTIKHETIELNINEFPDYNGIILFRDTILGKEQNKEHIQSIVVCVGGWNNYVRDKNRMTGLFEFKLKQLEILGHKTIVIPWYQWREQESSKDRLEFIKRKLSPFL